MVLLRHITCQRLGTDLARFHPPTVQARVSSVSLILFLPYLMMLMEFFTKNMPEQQPDKKPPGPPAVAAKP